MAEATPIVEMRNIKKSLGAVQALRGVDLVLHHNEVLGLVGDNAAGKSTLMKILSSTASSPRQTVFAPSTRETHSSRQKSNVQSSLRIHIKWNRSRID